MSINKMKYYNNHSLYIHTNGANKEQLINSIKRLILKILKDYPKLNKDFYVNFLISKD